MSKIILNLTKNLPNISVDGTNNNLISSSSGTWNTTAQITPNYNYNVTKYNIFGEEVEIDSGRDPFLAQNLALINVLGKPFYEELIKNGFVFTEKIESILQKKFRILERDKKINSVLDDRANESQTI
jgi:hypothetical protein